MNMGWVFMKLGKDWVSAKKYVKRVRAEGQPKNGQKMAKMKRALDLPKNVIK